MSSKALRIFEAIQFAIFLGRINAQKVNICGQEKNQFPFAVWLRQSGNAAICQSPENERGQMANNKFS